MADEPQLLRKCPAAPCELREQLKRHRELAMNERIEEKLAETKQAIEEHSTAEKDATDRRSELEGQLETAKTELSDARERQTEGETKLIEQIGRWKQHVADAVRFDGTQRETMELEKSVSDLSRGIEDSNDTQDVARSAMDHRHRVHLASIAYTQVLQRFFDENEHHTRVILHGREDDGRLLRQAF